MTIDHSSSDFRAIEEVIAISIPGSKSSKRCAAIFLASAYYKISVNQWEKPAVLEYIRQQQDSWQNHVDKTSVAHFHDRPLLVILHSYRTSTWALAAAQKPVFENLNDVAMLKNTEEGQEKLFFWESKTARIHTRFGPSRKLMDNMNDYFTELDNSTDPGSIGVNREEIKRCHAIAVGVVALQSKKWPTVGGSIRSRWGSASTLKPNSSRNNILTGFTSVTSLFRRKK